MTGDVIYSIREGGMVVGKGNAEFLNLFFLGLEGAIAGYWERRNRVPAECVKRLYAYHGSLGPWRAPLLKFLEEDDQHVFKTYPELGEAYAELVWKAEFEAELGRV
jgi:hypothetical protein